MPFGSEIGWAKKMSDYMKIIRLHTMCVDMYQIKQSRFREISARIWMLFKQERSINGIRETFDASAKNLPQTHEL